MPAWSAGRTCKEENLMADEISQVVEMECKGTYYLFKGTKEFIALAARAVVAIQGWIDKKYLKMPGNCSYEKIQKISEGTPPLLEFPKEMFEAPVIGKDKNGNPVFGKSEFDQYCEAHKLRYCIMPDLNPNDDYIPVAIPAQDMGIHQEMIKAVMNRRIASQEQKDSEYDDKIVAAKEKALNAKTPEEKKSAEENLKALEEAKAQNKELLKESKSKADKNNVLDFAEYLKQGEGTLVMSDPKKALEEANQCGIVKEFKPYDCMWPVRDDALVPESGKIYYSQTTKDQEVHYIRREFRTDDQGQIYSEYFVRMPGTSSEKTFSDKGLSRLEWEKKIPELLEAAGLQNDVPMAVVQSSERFAKYREFVEENFNSARDLSSGEKKDRTYSSPEAEEFVESHNKDLKRQEDLEDTQFTKMTVPSERLLYDSDECLCLQTEDGLLQGAMVNSIDDRYAEVFIRTDNTYSLKQTDGNTISLPGADIIGRNSGAEKDPAKAFSRKGR